MLLRRFIINPFLRIAGAGVFSPTHSLVEEMSSTPLVSFKEASMKTPATSGLLYTVKIYTPLRAAGSVVMFCQLFMLSITIFCAAALPIAVDACGQVWGAGSGREVQISAEDPKPYPCSVAGVVVQPGAVQM